MGLCLAGVTTGTPNIRVLSSQRGKIGQLSNAYCYSVNCGVCTLVMLVVSISANHRILQTAVLNLAEFS